MPYGTIKVDTVTFTDAGVDKSVSISGLVQNPTFSGNITVTGTISGGVVRGDTVSGATVTGAVGNFVSGVFTSQISGATITGNIGSFTTFTGGTATFTSGVFASGTAAAPSVSIGTTTNGLYSSATNEVAISTNGTGRLFVDSTGKVGLGTASASALFHAFSTGTDWLGQFGNITANGSNVRIRHNAIGAFAANSVASNLLLNPDGGNVGIGNSGPGSALVVSTVGSTLSGTSNTYGLYINPISTGYIYIDALTGTTSNTSLVLRTYNNGTYNNLIQSISGNETTFSVGGDEAVRIDASRRLLVGLNSTSYGPIGSIVQRASGTSAAPNVFRSGGWSICSIHGEPSLVLSSNVSAAGASGSTETARCGIGFEYVSSTQPTRMVIGTVVASTVPSPVTFWSEGTERMRINTSGILTAATATATNGSTIIQGYYSEPDHINVIGSQYSSAATAICYAIRPKSGSAGYVSAAGNSSFAKGVIELDGNCAFKFGSAATVPIGTAVSLTEVARFTTTGLTFNGDIAAANALDDYEEGTWTPSVGGTAAYNIQEGRYTKIGRIVHVSFYMTITSIGTGSTNSITGLPFNAGNDTGGSSVSYYTGLSTSVVQLFGYIYSSNIIYLYSATGASTVVTLNSVLGNNCTIQGHLCYFV